INYGRALEGELERTVSAMSQVERARVHITFPKDSVFEDSRQPAKASVMVKLRPGARLSPQNVSALTHLLSSAVEGLSPDAVAVLDMQGNLLSRPGPDSPDQAASEAALDYRQKVEYDLLQKISSTLDPLLGHDRYRASLSVDVDRTSTDQNEETLDPEKTVMITSQKTEEVTGSGSSGGVPGTSANLPRATTHAGSGISTTRRTENISWQPSHVTRTTHMPQGGLKRMSVAVLLDQNVHWEGSGRNLHHVVTPPTPEVLQSVKDVVTAAIGFVGDRDQITVETLPFEETLNQPAPEPVAAVPVPTKTILNQPTPVIVGVGGLLVLILGVAVFLIARTGRVKSVAVQDHAPGSLPGPADSAASLESAAEAEIQAQLAEREEEQRKADLAVLSSIRIPPVKTKKAEVLAKQIREIAKKDSGSSVQVLQSWIHDR
ncbi:MAG TPA: flagellar basal-body MS-ring/collar protein FliF, partial [Bryobacteraceae bacterium]|nr:flagellar basal-body MS-ring/collar protein FliF [Bryobacteraceae bacterium]